MLTVNEALSNLSGYDDEESAMHGHAAWARGKTAAVTKLREARHHTEMWGLDDDGEPLEDEE